MYFEQCLDTALPNAGQNTQDAPKTSHPLDLVSVIEVIHDIIDLKRLQFC